ncbi:MAG: hypothetical protein ACFCBU_03160 [Cyanophyceae cyanobacterium]
MLSIPSFGIPVVLNIAEAIAEAERPSSTLIQDLGWGIRAIAQPL